MNKQSKVSRVVCAYEGMGGREVILVLQDDKATLDWYAEHTPGFRQVRVATESDRAEDGGLFGQLNG